MKLTTAFLALVMSVSLHADTVCIKMLMIAVPTSSGVQFRECKYFVSEESANSLPKFTPESDTGLLSASRAFALAFEGHFAKHGVSKKDFYRMAQLSFEKVDDYTESQIARDVRRARSKAADLWFYVIKCGDPMPSDPKLGPAPVVILMDGTLVSATERIKGMP